MLREFVCGISASNADCSGCAEYADGFACPVAVSRSDTLHSAFIEDFHIRSELMSIFSRSAEDATFVLILSRGC